jgi:hypothetical protein
MADILLHENSGAHGNIRFFYCEWKMCCGRFNEGVMTMILLRIFRFSATLVLVSCIFLLPLSYAAEDSLNEGITENVVLTPADQLILDRIDRVNDRIDKLGKELNGRIDKVNDHIDNLGKEMNGRIDTLWITMLGGFMGVMAFIGAIVFWDRSTFMKRARKECHEELSDDRRTLESMLAAMRKLSEKFPELREALNSFGLL